ncbi:hypothetical protein N9094_00930 [bacterium]|jgi:hypothetical protein|nr:hypothetical protein [bacterium]
MIGCDGLMKAPYLLVTSCLVFYLASCDLGVEPDPVEEEEVVQRELTPEQRRKKEGANLFAPELALPSGTKLTQSRSVTMEHLGVNISQGGKTVATGAADIAYEEARETVMVSKSIAKFIMGDAGMKMKLTLRDQPPNETVEPYPLEGQTIVKDGDQVSMEDVPNDDQKEAMNSFRAAWFGGNALFVDAMIKRRGSWDVAPETVLEAIFSETFTSGSGDVKLSVQKFFSFEGVESAEVTVSLNRCRATMVDSKGQEVEVELQAYGTLYRSLDPPHTTRVDIDGKVQMKMVQGDSELQFNGPFECQAKSDVVLPK